jgi:hypothetical protein
MSVANGYTRPKHRAGGDSTSRAAGPAEHLAPGRHLHAVIALMRISTSWDQFITCLDVAIPKLGSTRMLPFMTEIEMAHK